jgi:glutathione S-transferase
MKLFFKPGACSLSPHSVLREAGLPFELEQVDLRTAKTQSGADYTRINPNGYVPALMLDSGEVLTEGAAIVQYLADQRPESGLAPAAGTMERYHLMEWLSFIGSEIHKAFSPLFNPSAAEAWKEGTRQLLTRRLDTLAQRLEGKSYVMGEQFTVADAYLFTVLSWGGIVDVDLSRWPVLTRYLARIAARPSVQEALRAEGLVP